MSIGKEKKSKRGPGRPKMAKGEGKKIIKPIRFTEDELRLFEMEAKKNNQTFSEWVRGMLRQAVR